jgi:hypothetical protein
MEIRRVGRILRMSRGSSRTTDQPIRALPAVSCVALSDELATVEAMLWKFRKRKKKVGPRLAIGIGIALVVYTVGGFFGAPPIIKSQLEKRASEALGRKVTVGKVRVNPYTVSLTLENLDVRLKEGEGSFLGWTRLYVNAEPLSSIFGPWTLGAVELDGFQVTAELKQDGTFNFADIIERLNAAAKAPGTAKAPPAVRVGSLKVQGARLDFVDQSRSRPFATTFGPVGFILTEFQTTVAQGAPYRFEAVTEAGERLAWSGTLSAMPLASTGELRVENILLPKYAPYYADRILADLTSGKLSVSGRYEAKFDGGSKVLKLAGGALQLRDLKLVERSNQEPLVDLPALDITGADADAVTLKAKVGSVVLNGGRVRVRRETDGSLNVLAALLPPPPDGSAPANPSGHKAPPTVAPPAAPARRPDFLIGEVAVKEFAVDVADLAAPRPTQLGLTGIQFSLKNVTLADGAQMPLQLDLGWAPTGTVKVAGTVAIKPELKATLQTDVTALALLPLSPYLEQFVNAHITQGMVSTSGEVHVVMMDGKPAIVFDGGVNVEKLGLVDGAQSEELAGFATLTLSGLKAVTGPQLEVSLAEVTLAAPYARVLVNKDRTLNLATLMKRAAAAPVGGVLRPDSSQPSGHKAPPTVESAQPASAPLPRIVIGKVMVSDGDFSLTDRSLEPNVRVAVTQFGGIIAGLSSENPARADVDLKATVDGVGPVAITGKFNPLGVKKFVDLSVDFKNVDLIPFSPYSGKYAGYELARGQLNLDVAAKLDGKQLDAKNVITLNQFTFGAPVASPDAVKLPVRLGVALLKDANGQIVIDVPMSGSIDDPNLRIGKVVWRVIGNLLTKAATSPFALLGSMFGGGGEELAFQEFVAGGSELQPAEMAKLVTMTKALTNRPGLSLAIEGSFDGPADTEALKQRKLAVLVRTRIWEERRVADPNIPPPEQLEITPEVHATAVVKLFDEKFPSGPGPGTSDQSGGSVVAMPPPAPVIAAPPPPRKNIIRRVVEALTSRSTPPAEPAKPAESAEPAEPVPTPAEPAVMGPSLEEMTARLAATMEVTDNDLRALAAARAQRVRDYFLNEGKIAADRLFLASGNAAAKENKGARVFLSLQ